jgi:hypothetical protein
MGSGGESEQLFYRPECFRTLKRWLELVALDTDADGAALYRRSAEISPHLAEYLQINRFAEVWDKLRRNHTSSRALMTAFHGWFDGLKTMKLVHHLSDGPYARCEPDAALAELFAWRGLVPANGMEAGLEQLRRLQNGSDHVAPP